MVKGNVGTPPFSMQTLVKTAFISAIVCICVVRFESIGGIGGNAKSSGSLRVTENFEALDRLEAKIDRVEGSAKSINLIMENLKAKIEGINAVPANDERNHPKRKLAIANPDEEPSEKVIVSKLLPISDHPPIKHVVVSSESLRAVTESFHEKGIELDVDKVTLHAFDIPYAFFFEKFVGKRHRFILYKLQVQCHCAI